MVHESSTATPRSKRREATTERILDVAEGLIEREGTDALTMQRLASELGYTVGATYRYYASKDAIVAALQQRVLEALATDLVQALARDDEKHPRASRVGALTRVAIVARVYATVPARRPTHASLLARMLGDPRHVLPEALGSEMASAAIAIGADAVRALDEARASGALGDGDARERALLLWASLQGLAQARKLERWGVPGLDVDRLTGELVRTLLVGWGADGARARDAIARAAEIEIGTSGGAR